MKTQTIIGAVLLTIGIIIIFAIIINLGTYYRTYQSLNFHGNSEIWVGIFLVIIVSCGVFILPGALLLFRKH